MGTSGLGMAGPNEPLPTDDEFDVYRKRMMLAYKYRPNPMVRGRQTSFSNRSFYTLFKMDLCLPTQSHTLANCRDDFLANREHAIISVLHKCLLEELS